MGWSQLDRVDDVHGFCEGPNLRLKFVWIVPVVVWVMVIWFCSYWAGWRRVAAKVFV